MMCRGRAIKPVADPAFPVGGIVNAKFSKISEKNFMKFETKVHKLDARLRVSLDQPMQYLQTEL